MAYGTFYMVLSENSDYTKYRHSSFDAARTEAGRLAAANPGVRFYVLAAVGYQHVERPNTWTAFDDAALDIPF